MGLCAGYVTRVNFHSYQFILDTVFLPLPRSQCSNIYTQSNMVVHSFLMANQFNSVNCSKHRCRTKTIDRSYVATPNKKERVGENHYYQCTHLSLDGCRVVYSYPYPQLKEEALAELNRYRLPQTLEYLIPIIDNHSRGSPSPSHAPLVIQA